MKRKKSKKQSWIDIKRSISDFGQSQLIGLVKEIYELSEGNKNFLHARFSTKSDHLKEYKKIISDSLYPDVMDKNVDFEFDRAKKAINDYFKATTNYEGTADLMVYYVECGNQFTLNYGDINEFFYDALIDMYRQAIQAVRKMPKKKQEGFRKRLEKIMKSSDCIGWGYHDDLSHFYHETFE